MWINLCVTLKITSKHPIKSAHLKIGYFLTVLYLDQIHFEKKIFDNYVDSPCHLVLNVSESLGLFFSYTYCAYLLESVSSRHVSAFTLCSL